MFRPVLLTERQILALRACVDVDGERLVKGHILRPAELADLKNRLAVPA